MQTYLVGGAVRDQIMGRKCKDFDYTVVLDDIDRFVLPDSVSPFDYMAEQLERQGYKVFVSNPEFLTVRAMFPKGHVNERQVADFVLARKEDDYTDGRRPDRVQVGTLLDDQQRRDFRMNSIAQAADGSYIDPFGGQEDIRAGRITAVGDPVERFTEDSLRILRAIRFSVTLGFYIGGDTEDAMMSTYRLLSNVSKERINDEVGKMFAHSTPVAVQTLFHNYPIIGNFLVNDLGIRLMPTMKEK